MEILVLNGGSSSIKFSLFSVPGGDDDPRLELDGELSGLGERQGTLTLTDAQRKMEERVVRADTPKGAIDAVLDSVLQRNVDAVGHRVVHPGPHLKDHVRITEKVLTELEAAAGFAPLHDPDAIVMIRAAMRRLPHVPHVACFDTVFHQTMPEEASSYPIPKYLRELGLRRYGFHGLSCESVVRQLRRLHLLPRRLVIAHLGSGCSVTALRDGESIDTTMGLTPTGGVVMGTRPGDLDPGLMLYLLRQDTSAAAVSNLERMLNHDAGMVALTGLKNDMKAVRSAAARGNTAALLALAVFTRSVRKAIGGFAWLLGGLDAIVFTGGIGEHDAATRREILADSEISIHSSLNEAHSAGIVRFEASNSKTAVFAVTAQEDLVIALHVRRVVQVEA